MKYTPKTRKKEKTILPLCLKYPTTSCAQKGMQTIQKAQGQKTEGLK